MQLPNKVYDILKWLCIVILPALSTLYAKLAAIWLWPYAEQIPQTISAVELFLGAAVCISSANYNQRLESDGEAST